MITAIEPNIYAQLYDIYKQKENQKSYKQWEEYEISVSNNMLEKIAIFKPTNR